MLTKTDLKAIKQIVQDVAVTKNDAKNFATKDDFKNFATKKDLNGLASKKDLIGLARGTEIDELKITFIDNLEKWKNELYNKIDPILNRLKTAEEENIILRARADAREEIRKGLDTRLNKLESIHPNGRHQYP